MGTENDHDLLVQIARDTKANKESLGILFRTIEGNGQPGLKQRMTTLEASHNECQRQRDREADQEPAKQGNVIAWMALVVTVATLLAVVFT